MCKGHSTVRDMFIYMEACHLHSEDKIVYFASRSNGVSLAIHGRQPAVLRRAGVPQLAVPLSLQNQFNHKLYDEEQANQKYKKGRKDFTRDTKRKRY
jgi:hypothetical protein